MTAEPSTESSASASSSPAPAIKFEKGKLLQTVQTTQFAWFVGNVLTILGFLLYSLTYLDFFPSFYKPFYFITLIGVLISFGILIFQLIQTNGFRFTLLIKDDNTHYLLLGGFLLFLRPYVWITLIPYFVFSIFHVLAYTSGNLLPIFGLEKSIISKYITSFVSANNAKSIQVASGIELITLIWLLIRMFTFRKRSLSPVLVYLVFTKKRYEVSPFTRNYLKVIKNAIDQFVNDLNQPIIKEGWSHIQKVFAVIDSYKLVNDYTLEKAE
ncbi:POM33 [Candida oxycetoniae]|uniref:POM33 n=1 Tax=Candida oxycetoniae TaxID=497107 RepID=A0AAI9T2J7_9ASCO|nr:POM33 [Candida oxycetoniae]KAI3407065.1 POM33 [Candida oxycetoniae]